MTSCSFGKTNAKASQPCILIDFFKVGDDIKDLFKNYKDNLDMLFTYLAQAYIVHTGDVEKDGDYLYIPLYMVPCL